MKLIIILLTSFFFLAGCGDEVEASDENMDGSEENQSEDVLPTDTPDNESEKDEKEVVTSPETPSAGIEGASYSITCDEGSLVYSVFNYESPTTCQFRDQDACLCEFEVQKDGVSLPLEGLYARQVADFCDQAAKAAKTGGGIPINENALRTFPDFDDCKDSRD